MTKQLRVPKVRPIEGDTYTREDGVVWVCDRNGVWMKVVNND